MFRRIREAPGLIRAILLNLAILGIWGVAAQYGQPVNWEPAIVYGLALAISMRWPLVLDRTGSRVILASGLIFEALWFHGLPTALVLLLVEFEIRLVAVLGSLWAWYRPIAVGGALSIAYFAGVVVAGGLPVHPHALKPLTDAAAFVQVFLWWTLMITVWTYAPGIPRGRSRLIDAAVRMQQTWWAPVVFGLVAWLFGLVHLYAPAVVIPGCLALVWIQATVGPIFTTMAQDRAMSDLLRVEPIRTVRHREDTQWTLRYAYAIGQALGLTREDLRLIGYAVMLQDYTLGPGESMPRWLPEMPASDRAGRVRGFVEQTAAFIGQVGPLDEVAEMVRCRYASFDGAGYPALAGSSIPAGAQVLGAANAVVSLMRGDEERPMDRSAWEAAELIRTRYAARFSPDVLVAVVHSLEYQQLDHPVTGGIPQTVRQLQGLVAAESRTASVREGLTRAWYQMRGQIGLVPELPAEVLAVARLASFFATSNSVEQTARIVVEAVGELVGGKVALALNDSNGSGLELRFIAAHGFTQLDLTGRVIAVHGGVMGRALLNREPAQVPDLGAVNGLLARDVSRAEGVRSVLFVPLVGRNQSRGVLLVGMLQHHWFTPREVGLIHLMAGQAAVALENAILMAELADRLDHISRLKAFTDILLDNLRKSIIVVDPEGRLMLANASARARFGEQHRLVAGEPLPDEIAGVCPAVEALGGESIPEHDVPYDGLILEVAAAPLRDSQGALLGAISLAKDVTRVREMERHVRQVEKLAAMGELAAGAAHEIRNPLTSIRGFIQLFQARSSAGDREFFQIILNEIDRIDAIIRDLLVLARPSEMERRETNLADLVDDVLLLQRQELERRRVAAFRIFDPAVGSPLADPKMIRQLLLNLIINAIQAMPGGGRLSVSLSRPDPAHVALEVADTGTGIAPENLSKVFVPFFTTKEEGTGLGLALSYSIVEAHDGRIDVRSEVGKGTTFTVVLPG